MNTAPRTLTIDGETLSVYAWTKRKGARCRGVILDRIARGMSPRDAVFSIANADRARLLEINGHTMTTAEWSRMPGAHEIKAIRARLASGLEPIDAVFYQRDYAPRPISERPTPAPVSVYALRPTWGGVTSISFRR